MNYYYYLSRFRLSCLLLWLLGSLLFPNPVLSLENYQEGATLFFDDFSDGNMDGWTVETGPVKNWLIDASKRLVGSASGRLVSGRIGTGGEWDNYRLELDVKNDYGIDEGVGFRRKDANNTYEVTLRHGTGAGNTPEIYLTRVQDGINTQLFSTHTVPLSNGVFYHIKIEAVEDHLQMWVNSTLVFDITDTGTTVKKGPISLSHWTGPNGSIIVRFDNIKVTSLSKLKFPVIFIPGIGGSEFSASQDIFYSGDDGHGGTYSHAYSANEKIWVNEDEAVKLGDDDYFDVLKLKDDGATSVSAGVSLTGNLTSQGYGDINTFFPGIGYSAGTNFFIFPYDWRKDIRTTQTDLDNLVELAKQKSGQPKVNIVAHSLGGLVARHYISDEAKAAKVNKLISLGVPHLGSVVSLKTLMYGIPVGKPVFNIFNIGLSASEVKDIYQNLTSAFILLPSNQFYNFYEYQQFPFYDNRDIDNNKEIGTLDFPQVKTLLTNLKYNLNLFNIAEEFHNTADNLLTKTNGVKLFNIVGSNQPTLGQIKETWFINWPVKLIPKRDEIFINGDDTVPLYSASLKNDTLDLSAGASIYYVDQKHVDLVRGAGAAMQTVKVILNEGDSFPVEVKSEKITLEGKQLSLDLGEIDLYDGSNNHTGLNEKGEVENNLPNVFYDSIEDTKHVFIKANAGDIKVKVKNKNSSNKLTLKLRDYTDDKVSKTVLYKDLPLTTGSSTEFIFTPTSPIPPNILIGEASFPPSSQTSGDSLNDTNPPVTEVTVNGIKNPSEKSYTEAVTITLSGSDTGSGVLQTEYSLDNGQTVNTYKEPIIIKETTTIIVKSTDKLGNEETPQSILITINIPAATQTSSTTSNPSAPSTSPVSSSPAPSNPPKPFYPSIPSALLNLFNEVKASDNKPDILGEKKEGPLAPGPAKKTTLNSIIIYTSLAAGVLIVGLISNFALSSSINLWKKPKP